MLLVLPPSLFLFLFSLLDALPSPNLSSGWSPYRRPRDAISRPLSPLRRKNVDAEKEYSEQRRKRDSSFIFSHPPSDVLALSLSDEFQKLFRIKQMERERELLNIQGN